MRLEDLPPAEQAQVRAALAGKRVVGRSRAGRREARGTGGRWSVDGELFDSYERAEAHADRVGSHRVEVVLEG